MIHVIASVQVKKDHLSEFLEIFKSNVPNVLQEKGCRVYVPATDAASDIPIQDLDENQVTIIEKWDSLEDLQTHLSAPHMIVYREKVKDLVEAVSLKVLEEA